jgi:uncharacterized protein YhdP
VPTANGDVPVVAERSGTPPFAPARAPTLDLSCDELHAGDANLGRLTLMTSRIAGGQQLDTLHLQGGDLQADMNGAWRRSEGQSSGELALSVDGGNIGAVFTALGYPQTLAAKQTRLKAALSWLPDAAGLQWQQTTGTIALDLHKGDLKSVELGAGRAIGMFSLYALPRRLLLDFHDIFAKGLGFDQLAGQFVLGGGQAHTDDLEIKSPSLRIVMHGRIGLSERDYDEHVTVYPDVTTGVTIAGGLAGGPLGAAIALVAQEVLGKPFNKLSQFSYHVTGPWDNPQIKHGEANKDECPEGTPAAAKLPTDARGKACSPRAERAPKAQPEPAPAAAATASPETPQTMPATAPADDAASTPAGAPPTSADHSPAASAGAQEPPR